MKRRVVKHGPSTLIISLPSKWAKQNEVVKGSELEVIESDKSLIVNAVAESEPKQLEVEVDLSGLDRTSIIYIIKGLYRLGYDVITARFDNPATDYQRVGKKVSVLSVIHFEVNRLIGFEVIEETAKSCVIKDLQAPSLQDFDTVLRRIFFLMIDAAKVFIEGAKVHNRDLLESVESKHDTITKFVSYCMRILNKKGHPNPKKTAYCLHIVALLDRITDVLKYAARDVLQYGKKLNPKVVEVLEAIDYDLELYSKLYYKFDREKIVEINTRRYKAESALRQLPNSTATLETLVAASTFSIMELLLDLIEARTALEY